MDKEEELTTNDNNQEQENSQPSAHSNYIIPDISDESKKHQLSGMFQDWFLDYASYVILDRAVPHLYDGFKPVQRRILYSMKRMDDGRYIKVANIVGHTMQFHPHGDSSIYGALVTLGQKNLLIDCQGNWGNIYTGDNAAAGRYIEARLSKFALEVLFNSKTTEWQMSYDGRNREPVALPVKFPLLLAQGADGIGVGLSTKILPHNFNELIDASIAYLRNEDFVLYPDFPTGGLCDVSHYLDGRRDGKLKIRARISKIDNKTLCISEIPYGTYTKDLTESILRANEKGKIKIKKVEDNTAKNAEIIIHLDAGRSPDKTIDALYAFTDCQLSVSPNCCIIYNDSPHFVSVSEVLKFSTDNTKNLLKQELLIRKGEILESIFFMSLERWFISERIYKKKEFEESTSAEEAIAFIDKCLEPIKSTLIREVEHDDIAKLMEIKMQRIIKYSADKADQNILALKKELKEVEHDIEYIVEYTIKWFEHLKATYGADYPRKTEIRNFDTIEVTKVVEANEKLYINRAEGFIGTSLKNDELISPCSDIDDIIIFYKDGTFKVIKVGPKVFVGKNVMHVAVYKKNDNRTIYNMIYRNGKDGVTYIKRFAAGGTARDKEYSLTSGEPGTKILYFTANPNGEAETIKVFLRPKPRMKVSAFEKSFGDIAIKGRAALGNVLTKNDIMKIVLKSKGTSTLGGRQVWYDESVRRLNYDGRGELLGEFQGEDKLLILTQRGTAMTSGFDITTHFPDDILKVEKFDAEKVWTAALFDADQGFQYIKRFQIEAGAKEVSLLGENAKSKLILLTDTPYPRFEVTFGGADSDKEHLIIDCEEFIGVKSQKARGKRISTLQIESVVEIEPLRVPEEISAEDNSEVEESGAPGDDGQYSLF